MIEKIFNYLKTNFNRALILGILKAIGTTSIFGTLITLGSLTFYTIGYSFLYGYYFSGMSISPTSLIKLLVTNVPFPFYSVIICSIMFLCAVSFFIVLLWNIVIACKHLFKKEDRHLGFIRIIIMLVSFTIFHYALTAFFIGGSIASTVQLVSFLRVWIGPFFVAAAIYIIFQIKNGIISTFAGMVFGFIIFSIGTGLLDIESSIKVIILPFGIFLTGFLFSFFEHCLKHFFYRFLLAIPFAFIFMLILDSIFTISLQSTWVEWVILIISIISLSAIASALTKKWTQPKIESDSLSEEEMEQNRISNKAEMKRLGTITLAILFVLSGLSFISTSIPVTAGLTGSFFRLSIPHSNHQNIYYENIGTSNTTKNDTNAPQLKNVELVAQKDDMYYISDSNAKLIMIKTDKIEIQSSSD